MIREIIRHEGDRSLNALLFHPQETKELPLLIYLHGAGERGENLDHLYRHGLPELIQKGECFDAIVLAPQCPAPFVWNNVVVRLKTLIDEVVERFDVLPDRICLTGSSMGGFGTWEMGMTYRNFFSAIAPVAGGGLSWRAANLRTTPVRAYHGAVDGAVLPIYSKMMVDAVNRTGGHAELTLFEGLDHNPGIDEAYERTDLIPWLLAQRRTDFTRVPECLEDMF